MSFDYILYELSYQNFTLYSAVIPSFHHDNDKKKDDQVIDATDPSNAEKVKQIFKKFT